MQRGGIDGPADKGLQGSWSGAPWRRSAAVPGRRRVASSAGCAQVQVEWRLGPGRGTLPAVSAPQYSRATAGAGAK